MSKLSDIIHSLFGTYKTAFLPVFDKLLPYFQKLLVRMSSADVATIQDVISGDVLCFRDQIDLGLTDSGLSVYSTIFLSTLDR